MFVLYVKLIIILIFCYAMESSFFGILKLSSAKALSFLDILVSFSTSDQLLSVHINAHSLNLSSFINSLLMWLQQLKSLNVNGPKETKILQKSLNMNIHEKISIRYSYNYWKKQKQLYQQTMLDEQKRTWNLE